MKTLCTLLLALISTTVMGQQFFTGLNGGLQSISKPFGAGDYISSYESRAKAIFGLKAGINVRRLQLGAGIRFGSIGTDYTMRYKGTSIAYASYSYSANMLYPYIFANFKHSFARSEIYYGLNGGYLRIAEGKNMFTWLGRNKQYTYIISPASTITAGAQAGYRFALTHDLGIAAELGALYHFSSFDMPFHDINAQSLGSAAQKGFLSFPLLLGIDYRL